MVAIPIASISTYFTRGKKYEDRVLPEPHTITTLGKGGVANPSGIMIMEPTLPFKVSKSKRT